jgi:hypothetical protein
MSPVVGHIAGLEGGSSVIGGSYGHPRPYTPTCLRHSPDGWATGCAAVTYSAWPPHHQFITDGKASRQRPCPRGVGPS